MLHSYCDKGGSNNQESERDTGSEGNKETKTPWHFLYSVLKMNTYFLSPSSIHPPKGQNRQEPDLRITIADKEAQNTNLDKHILQSSSFSDSET